jgi:hypothetical protein
MDAAAAAKQEDFRREVQAAKVGRSQGGVRNCHTQPLYTSVAVTCVEFRQAHYHAFWIIGTAQQLGVVQPLCPRVVHIVGCFKVHIVNHNCWLCTPLPSCPPYPQDRISQLEGQLARAQSVEQEAQRLSAQLATVQVGRNECLRASVEMCSSEASSTPHT